MFVFPWEAMPSLGLCMPVAPHYSFVSGASHSPAVGPNKEDRRVQPPRGRERTHCLHSLGCTVFIYHVQSLPLECSAATSCFSTLTPWNVTVHWRGWGVRTRTDGSGPRKKLTQRQICDIDRAGEQWLRAELDMCLNSQSSFKKGSSCFFTLFTTNLGSILTPVFWCRREGMASCCSAERNKANKLGVRFCVMWVYEDVK